MLRFFVVFFAIQGVLFGLSLWQPVRRLLIDPFTTGLAHLSAFIAGLFDSGVASSGIILMHIPNNFAVRIEAGCNGVEAMIILVAAILAFPASWKQRLVGLVLGFLAIQVLNLVRILSLFYIGQWNLAVFEFAHLYVWQALIMLDALIFWLIWVKMLPRSEVSNPLLVERKNLQDQLRPAGQQRRSGKKRVKKR